MFATIISTTIVIIIELTSTEYKYIASHYFFALDCLKQCLHTVYGLLLTDASCNV